MRLLLIVFICVIIVLNEGTARRSGSRRYQGGDVSLGELSTIIVSEKVEKSISFLTPPRIMRTTLNLGGKIVI